MKKTILLTLMAMIGISAHCQIINIESKRIATDTIGFSGNLGASLSAARFTQSFVAAEIAGQIQYKTDRNLFLIIGDLDIVNAGGTSFNNSGYGHFRYNRKLSETIRMEMFTQVQYNSVTKITARLLSGAGLRLKLSPYETAKIYYGVAAMHEHEELSDPQIITNDVRLSSYLTFTLIPVETISMRNTTYIQPLASDFNDYRLANTTNLNFGITDNLSFVTNLSFLYDSRPPIDVPTINYQVKNGLTYKFD